MKTLVKLVLQKILGFRTYLFVFALYIFYTLRFNKKEGDFIHFMSLLPDGVILLDIGANIGVMSAHLARKFPSGTIIAFEPVPDNVLTIKKIIRFFNIKNIRLFEIALGDSNGTAEIILPEQKKVKFQGLSHIKGIEGNDNETGTIYKVDLKTLDSLDSQSVFNQPVAGIKIDVENYESFVLSGGKNLISNWKPVIYAELWDNANRTECINLLTGLGYKTYILLQSRLVEYNANLHQSQNFFFRHPSGF
jgi:FkbM family methyltransferase